MKYAVLLITVLFVHYAPAEIEIPRDDRVLSTYGSVSQQSELDPNEINLLVWNMYKGINNSWKEDFQNLAKDKDILILQEGVLSIPMRMVFYLHTHMQFFFATSFIEDWQPTGVVTSATVYALDKKWQRSYYREPVIKTPKMTLFTKYGVQNSQQEVLVGNIHGVNFVKEYKLRHMLVEAAKEISKHSGPVIFGGDFNTWTKTKLATMNGIFKKLGMKAVKFTKDNRKRFRGNILDHVWVRGFKVLSSSVPLTSGSDHNPMLVKLAID